MRQSRRTGLRCRSTGEGLSGFEDLDGALALSHRWLDSLSADEQREELRISLELLRGLGYGDGEYVVSYPYGGFDEHTLPAARELGFSLGFSVEARAAKIGRDDPLLLPRLDTVDLPFSV